MNIRGCLAVMLATLPAIAHDLYIMPHKFAVKTGEDVLLSLHVGDSFPASEGPVAPQRIVIARLSDGQTIEDFRILGRATHAMARIKKPGTYVAAVGTAPRFLEMPPQKFESYLTEEGLSQVLAWRRSSGEANLPGREVYRKFAKSLIVGGRPDDGWARPAGLPIEIIPEANPEAIPSGGSLPVRVLFEGQPAAGLQLEAAWAADGQSQVKVVGRTDSEGRIRVPLTRAGIWRLHSVTMRRSATPATADWESFWASLTFEVN